VAGRAMHPHVCAKGDIPLLEYHVEECPPPTAPPGPLLRPLLRGSPFVLGAWGAVPLPPPAPPRRLRRSGGRGGPVILPRFVQSPLLRSVPGIYHAFLGIDPVPGRGDAARLRTVFCVPPSRIGTLRQVHSATVLEWDEADAIRGSGGRREGDVLW